MTHATLVQEFAAAGWSHTAAAELAQIHLDLQAKSAAAQAAARAIATARQAVQTPAPAPASKPDPAPPAALPAESTGRAFGRAPRREGGGQWDGSTRLIALAIAAGIWALLSHCGALPG